MKDLFGVDCMEFVFIAMVVIFAIMIGIGGGFTLLKEHMENSTHMKNCANLSSTPEEYKECIQE